MDHLHLIQPKSSIEIQSLYDTYAPILHGAILGIISDPTKAEDVLSRVFYTLVHEIQTYKHKNTLALWLLNLSRQECVRQLIKENEKHMSAPVNPYAISLPLLPKTIFALVYLKGLNITEVASLLHVPTICITNIFEGLPKFTPYMFPNIKRNSSPTPDILQSLIQHTQPDNDAQRLAALKKFEILYTPPEKAFDKITQIVARVFDTPMSFLSLVDEDTVFYKSQAGPFGRTQVARENSLCSLTILSKEPLVIEDASLASCFKDNPFVQIEGGIRFYAGAPLITKDGFVIGALCVVDTKHRTFSFKDTLLLTEFAEMAMLELESRHSCFQHILFMEQVAAVTAPLLINE